MKKTHQTNIAVQNTDHSLQYWSEVFFFNFTKMFLRYYCYTCIFHSYFTR